jgi:hypothetical protein
LRCACAIEDCAEPIGDPSAEKNFSGVMIQHIWGDPEKMREFLRGNGAAVLIRAGSIQKEHHLALHKFQVQDRVSAVTQVLELWFDRYKTVKKAPNDPNRMPHIVVAASPGKFVFFLKLILPQFFCLIH